MLFGVILQSSGQTYSAPATAGTAGSNNTNVGASAGSNSAHGNNNNNTNIGANTGSSNVSGDGNSFLGFSAGFFNTSGRNNAFIGIYSGEENTEGSFNSFLGAAAGRYNTIGGYNVFLGFNTGINNALGSYNTFLGYSSGSNNQNGNENISLGSVGPTNGNFNILIGGDAGSTSGGNKNLMIGNKSGQGSTTGSNNTFIGAVALPSSAATATNAGFDTSNTIIISDNGNANGVSPGAQRLYIHSNGFAGFGLGDNVIPQNTLEIKSRPGSPSTAGLRLTSLPNTNFNTTATSPFRVLSVNAVGDVILVDDKQGSGTTTNVLDSSGNIMTSTVNGISDNATIINTVTNTISSGALTTTVNGVASNAVVLPTGGGPDTSIYLNDGNIVNTAATGGLRTVFMGNSNLFFNTAGHAPGVGGRIYIGDRPNFPTNTGDYRLYVEGGVLTEKVKVAVRTTLNWRDFVFANDYKLMPLKDVESFIKANKHLPEISSAEELIKDGLDLGEMQAKQMQKIEELTLYLIEQNKTLEKQSKEIEELKEMVKTLAKK